MPLAFNELIFDRTIRGTTEFFSSAQFNELIGRADDLIFEVEVSEASGTTPALTARVWRCSSNDDSGFKARTAFLSGASLASLPYRSVTVEGGTRLAGYCRIGFALSGADNIARIRVWATGRIS